MSSSLLWTRGTSKLSLLDRNETRARDESDFTDGLDELILIGAENECDDDEDDEDEDEDEDEDKEARGLIACILSK